MKKSRTSDIPKKFVKAIFNENEQVNIQIETQNKVQDEPHENIILDTKYTESDTKNIKFWVNLFLTKNLSNLQKRKIKNILETITNNTKNIETSCYIAPHMGLGDIINMIPAINYLSTIYDEVIVGVNEIYVNNFSLLMEYNPLIKIDPITINPIMSGPLFNNTINYNGKEIPYFGVGFWNRRIMGTYNQNTGFGMIPDVFYHHINLDFEYVYKNFSFVDDSHPIIFKEPLPAPHIFCHQRASYGQRITINLSNYLKERYPNNLIIDPDVNVYTPDHPFYEIAEKMVGKPILFYKKIIENAFYLCVIDSCFLCFANMLDLSNVRRAFYFDRSDDYVGKKYNYVQPKLECSSIMNVSGQL